MEVAMPMAGSAIDCYEDMFKEITRKLYGEDGLPDLTNIDRLPSTSQDRGLTPIDYDVETPILKPDEHLTAFGLAALMQNGFPGTSILNSSFPAHKASSGLPVGQMEDRWISSDETLQWTTSKIAVYNTAQKLFRCAECDCVGYLLRIAEHWLGTHSNLRAFRCTQCSYESAWVRCVRIHLGRQHNINIDESCDSLTKDNPVFQEIVKYLQKLKNKAESNSSKSFEDVHSNPLSVSQTMSNQSNSSSESTLNNVNKRYSCSFCPYATDRRDLFTRHENIHREEKPFQCYVCQKQFNRADHVKKHFLRMHRDHPYDLNRIRRHPPKNASGMSYYQKYNATPTLPAESLTTSSVNSLSIPGFNNMQRNPTVPNIRQVELKNIGKSLVSTKTSMKKKGEKRFSCCYCSWSGVDNWCLKRHMNTHLKPFVCALCDYKAARSERLATHVLKVHNKRTCGKCSFLADDLDQLSTHQREQHPSDHRLRISTSSSSGSILRTNSFTNGVVGSSSNTASNSSSCASSNVCSQTSNSLLKSTDMSAVTAAQLLHHNRYLQTDVKPWKSQLVKHAPSKPFTYMDTSDGSEPETEISRQNEEPSTSRVQSDFLEAGDVESHADTVEDNTEESELPLFVCPTCGCEFEDDSSLETHQLTHRHSATSPVKTNYSKENLDPHKRYRCRLCDASFYSQNAIISHMSNHRSLTGNCDSVENIEDKSRRKQMRPKKIRIPYWNPDDLDIFRQICGRLRVWRYSRSDGMLGLVEKYTAQLVTKRGLICRSCKNNGISRYHTRATLALHRYWRHSRKTFRCEHCDMTFKHRYQTILHSSRVHIDKKSLSTVFPSIPSIMRKDSTHISLESVAASQDMNTFSNFFNNTHNVSVPDANMSNAHKLGMSFFDHSFIHNNAISNHMPIIIPTFPPS